MKPDTVIVTVMVMDAADGVYPDTDDDIDDDDGDDLI